jgi:hypothetical protein
MVIMEGCMLGWTHCFSPASLVIHVKVGMCLGLQVKGSGPAKAEMVAKIFYGFRNALAYKPANAHTMDEQALLQGLRDEFKVFKENPEFAGEEKAMKYCGEWEKHLGEISFSPIESASNCSMG